MPYINPRNYAYNTYGVLKNLRVRVTAGAMKSLMPGKWGKLYGEDY
jgi:hypothetical protein